MKNPLSNCSILCQPCPASRPELTHNPAPAETELPEPLCRTEPPAPHSPFPCPSTIGCQGNLHRQRAPEEPLFHVAHWVLIPFLSPSLESSASPWGFLGWRAVGCQDNVLVSPTGQGRGMSGPSFGFKGSICGPSRGSGAPQKTDMWDAGLLRLLKPPRSGCLTTERGRGTLLGGPRGGRPAREHGRMHGGSREHPNLLQGCPQPRRWSWPPGRGRGVQPSASGAGEGRPGDGAGWPCSGSQAGRGLGAENGPHRNS